ASSSNLSSFQSDLERWAKCICDEKDVLMLRTVEDEHQSNSRFRTAWYKASDNESRHRQFQIRNRVLEACSTYDYHMTWKQTKVRKATHLRQETIYESWKQQTKSCTLLYMGKLGAGKSVGLANMVDDLNLQTTQKRDPTYIVYFFCRHDIPASLKAREI